MSKDIRTFLPNAKLVRRLSDGAIFEPSVPDNYDMLDCVAEILAGRSSWFLRKIEQVPRRWWHLRRRWKRTGEVWITRYPRSFEVITAREAWRTTDGE